MKGKIEQFIAQRVNLAFIWRQEFYFFCAFALVVTLTVVILLIDRLALVKELNNHISMRNTTALVLEQNKDSALACIRSNAICQWLDLDVVDESAIRAVECRYDSAQVVYQRLLQRGWKFTSLEDFERNHLPRHWRTQLEGYMQRQQLLREQLLVQINAVANVVIQQEADGVIRVRWMRYALFILVLVVFPLRWIYVYLILKKALRSEPLVEKSIVIGIGFAPGNRPVRGKS